MRNLLRLPALFLLLATTACHTSTDGIAKFSDSAFAEAPVFQRAAKFEAPAVDGSGQDVDASGTVPEQPVHSTSAEAKKIIKDGRITVKTNDIAVAKSAIDRLAKEFNASYDNEELQNDDRSTSYDLKLRIPAANFEKVLAAIEKGGDEITGKSIHSRDVTAEFIDVESRIENKRDYLKRYKELLAKANSVKDILEIQERIRSLQEELESREKQLKYLSDQVAFSTLAITLTKFKEYAYKPVQQDKFAERVKKSLNSGWSGMVSLLLWLISIWPFYLLIALAWLLLKEIRNRRKNIPKKEG